MRHEFIGQQGGGGDVSHMVFGIFMLLFWIAVIYIAVMFITRYLHKQGACQTRQDPLEIAKARYARGEITKEEFNQLKKDLA